MTKFHDRAGVSPRSILLNIDLRLYTTWNRRKHVRPVFEGHLFASDVYQMVHRYRLFMFYQNLTNLNIYTPGFMVFQKKTPGLIISSFSLIILTKTIILIYFC